MAKFRVWSGGNGTGGADNTDWAEAYTTLALANAAASANDIILIHYAHQEANTADITFTLSANTTIVAVDKDDGENYRAMGTAGWVGTATGSVQYSVTVAGNTKSHVYGLTIRNGGSSNDDVRLMCGDGASLYSTDVYMWLGTTSNLPQVVLGGSTNDHQSYQQHVNMTVRFSNGAQQIEGHGKCEIIGGSVSSAGSSPSRLVMWSLIEPGGAEFTWTGGDLTHVTNTLVDNCTSQACTFKFVQCRLHSSVAALATQTNLNRSSAEVYIIDCSDNAGTPARGLWGFYNMLGSVVKETGIYVTAGATGYSWKVVGTANSTIHSPFHTPWIDFYNSVNTAITPRLEILRDGSATEYTDTQVWAEWLAKTTSGSDRAAFAGSDRQALNAIIAGTAGANQATGAGLGAWTGEDATAWSGKCDSGSAITAAEDGYLRGRIAVVGAITVYVDPQVRTD